MDLMLIAALGGLVLLVLLALAIGAFWFLRRRAASKRKPQKTKDRVKKSTARKTPSKAPVQKRATKADEKTAKPQPTEPASPTPAATGAKAVPTPVTQTSVSKQPGDHTVPGDKIRILIVDDNPGTRENVSRLLYFEDDLEVIGQAVNGRHGIEMAIELKPHIVLMDINMPDMDGITATQKMGVEVPFSQVIIMSVQSDEHYMRKAMTAGARDFQPKPFTADELVSCIRRVYNLGLPAYQQFETIERTQAQQAMQPVGATRQDEAKAPVIAVYSPKGGAGTSAIAANLAVALHQEQGDAVLMDAALQFGDILVHLNTRATRTMIDLVHEDQLEVELLPDVLLAHDSGLKLLLAPPQPQLAEMITPEMVTEIIKGLKNQFKIVVVDTKSQLTDTTLAVFDIADHVLVLTTPELPAIKSAKLFLEIADLLEFDPNRFTVIINRAGIPGGISPDKVEQVLKLQQRTYRIPYDPKLHLALSRGQSIYQQDATAQSARAIADIAQRVWRKFSVTEAAVAEEQVA